MAVVNNQKDASEPFATDNGQRTTDTRHQPGDLTTRGKNGEIERTNPSRRAALFETQVNNLFGLSAILEGVKALDNVATFEK